MEVPELSEELLVNVFRWLDLPSLCRVAATCRVRTLLLAPPLYTCPSHF
jgi:hypothetical protein